MSEVYPGIHPNAQDGVDKYFSSIEKNIVNLWKGEWYITVAKQIRAGESSTYNYIFVRPTAYYEESLGIRKEIAVVFSPYSTFEQRTLSAIDLIRIQQQIQNERLERICYALISNDEEIESKLAERSVEDAQIIVPFTYSSFSNVQDNYFLRNQFWKYFHSRDLFGYTEPLKQEFTFFARSSISIDILQKHKSHQNYGLFGLRKSGKTSIIYDALRKLQAENSIGVFIDCQNPGFNMCKWNDALEYVVEKAYDACDMPLHVKNGEFSEVRASKSFEKYLRRIGERKSKRVLFFFDEIEQITFNKSNVAHWKNGSDFVSFWQTIRSVFQTTTDKELFTFCIMGTNPLCVEKPTIDSGVDNPIYSFVEPRYIQGFSIAETREMVRKLGKIMGIQFDESIYAVLSNDYGGHPFLIRQVCSRISKIHTDRPYKLTMPDYVKVRDDFNSGSTYFDMILSVLRDYYKDEYDMLGMLASGELSDFDDFASIDLGYTKHLLGYGIIQKSDTEGFKFNIDAVKQYLAKQQTRMLPSLIADNRTNIFISYCHEDAEYLDELKKHLTVLQNEDAINCWDDRQIKPGREIDDEIRQAIAKAKVAIMLVSPSFLNSWYIQNHELPILLADAKTKGTIIYWIPVLPSMVARTELYKYQAVCDARKTLSEMSSPERNKVYVKICDSIMSE